MTTSLFYTKAARVIVVLAFVLGVLSLFSGITMLGVEPTNPAAATQLQKLSGKSIDGGLYMILFAAVLGVLTEISQSLSEIVKNTKG
jgi:hypothetical protein